MKKQIYNYLDKEMVLLQEEVFSPDGVLLQSIDCSNRPHLVTSHHYSENGLLMESVEMEGDRELNKTVYSYNDAGKATKVETFIGGESFECTVNEYDGESYVQTISQDGEMIARNTHTKTDFGHIEESFDGEGQLLEYSHYHLNEKKKPIRVEEYDEDQELADTVIYTYNEDGHLVGKKFYDEDVLYAETKYDLAEGDQTVERIFHVNHEEDTPDEYLINYAYDERGNKVKEEEIVDGEVKKALHWAYDEQNRAIEMQGAIGRELDAFGNLTSPERFYHFVYKYVD